MMRLAVIVVLAGLSRDVAVSQTPQRFRSGADLVSVDVLVTNGREPLTGLRAADFELFDNGVPQSIEQLYLEQLPLSVIEETGGRLVYAEDDREVGATFARVFEEFNSRYVLGYSRYVLGYAPTGVSVGGWHRIEVRLKGRKGTVVARRGYCAS